MKELKMTGKISSTFLSVKLIVHRFKTMKTLSFRQGKPHYCNSITSFGVCDLISMATKFPFCMINVLVAFSIVEYSCTSESEARWLVSRYVNFAKTDLFVGMFQLKVLKQVGGRK